MIQPNLSFGFRVFYVLAGVGLLCLPFVFGLVGATRWIMIAIGILALLEGTVGW